MVPWWLPMAIGFLAGGTATLAALGAYFLFAVGYPTGSALLSAAVVFALGALWARRLFWTRLRGSRGHGN